MPDTVGLEYHEPTSLRAIANKARHHKRHRFGNLYRELNAPLLRKAWHRLNKSSASGIDRVSAHAYEQDLEANIADLVRRLKNKGYKAKLVRRKYIPKANGKQRPLGIPAVEDKLLQTAVSMLLEAIYEPDFQACSFGYRPKVGARDAVQALGFNLQYRPFGYVVEADIRGFFDHLDHGWLKKMLRQRIADEAFVGLIDKWLQAGILEPDGSIHYPETGSPQGGVISPKLANIYLHYVLDLWFEKVVKRYCKGKAMIVRYADDFVASFQYRAEAEAFYRVLPKRLGKFGLEVAPEKTQLLRFSRFHPSRRRTFVFLGFEYYWDLDRKGERRLKRRTSRTKMKRALKDFTEWVKTHRHVPTVKLFASVTRKLRGHYNYFGLPGNSRSIGEYHRKVLAIFFKWLQRRSRRHRMNGWRFYGLVERLGLPGPKIVPYPRNKSLVLV
jgi:RNA-directed DNA polymerase